jgi:SPP1 gp7 family putative phage head morphogenesis protein
MQRNLYKFSGAKSTVVLQEINQILQKEQPWKQFLAEVLKLNPKYNKNYLQAEWQTANQSAKHAKDWLYYKENVALYPNLEYRTQGDERVRDAHSLLNGVIAPLYSEFWRIHFFPNGWGCRCYGVQTAAKPTPEDKIPKLSDKDFPEEFRINAGESGQVFSEGDLKGSKAHPYFALTNNDDWKKSFELSKLTAPSNVVYNTGKNTLKVSPFADERDLKDNIDDAKIVIDKAKVNVEIKAHLDSAIVIGHKNPEYIIDEVTADRKAPTTDKIKNLRNIYKSATKQECEALVLNLSKTILKFDDVKAEVQKKFKTFPNIKTVYIIDKNGDCTIMQKEPNK